MRPLEKLATYLGLKEQKALTAERSRDNVRGAFDPYRDPPLSECPEVVSEQHLLRFNAQYNALPKGNILNRKNFNRIPSWETVRSRILSPQNAEKMQKVLKLQGGGCLYAVMEDGSLEFMDANAAQPPMFVKDNVTGRLQIILNRNKQEMDRASALINNEARTHDWASIEEMLDWAKQNGFEVFGADAEDERWFGTEMKLAEAARPDGLFVGKKGGPWVATALRDNRIAGFGPFYGDVYVSVPGPGNRGDGLGLLRRLRV